MTAVSPRVADFASLAGAQLAAAQVACVVAILGSWRVTAVQSEVTDQAVWLNVAVVGVLISGIFNGAALVRLRRAVAARRRALLADLDEVSGADAPWPRVDSDSPMVAVVGMALAHRPGCALVAGKPAERIVPASGRREPCGWCQP